MMRLTRNRRIETLTYLGLWLMVIALFVLGAMRSRSMDNLTPLTTDVIARMTVTFVPFLLLFAVNNWLLIPRLLFRNRIRLYFLCTVALLAVIWTWQYLHFMSEFVARPPQHIPPGPHHFVPLPLFLDFIFSLLIIGANLAIALLFQRFEDRLERESLMKANAENRLTYLKAQINPHFYMNMLNNIHGMIEVDPSKAQDMVIDMSHLMRYMLYDSSQPGISLSAELGFLNNYLRIMRQRYPESKVTITKDFPSETEIGGTMVPPLIFLVFIENAFKHGISYREQSFVSISVRVSGVTVEFSCLNSNRPPESTHTPGIGLRNVEQRLKLIYGDKYSLEITPSDTTYSVNLSIPAHETEDPDNR